MAEKEEKTVGVIYLGPSKFVRVVPYGEHYKDAVVEYPESFADELIESSKKQRFEIAGKNLTVPELKEKLAEMGVEYPKSAKKSELEDILKRSERSGE